jgi:hypothetical protein
MRVEIGETSLVVIDRPIVERFFNAFSAVVGGFAAWLCLRFYEPGGDWADLTLALLAPFLLVFAVAGIWRLLTLPTVTCRIDGARRIVELARWSPLGRRRTSWRFDDIADLRAELRPGYDSSWRAILGLRDGGRVALLPRADADRESVEAFVAQARRRMTTA